MPVDGFLGFDDLLSPLTVEHLLDRYWEKSPFANVAPAANRAASLLSFDDVEALIQSLTTVDADWIQVRTVGRPALSTAHYSTPDEYPDTATVLGLIDSGYSLILSKLHQRWPPLAALCRDVERCLTGAGIALSDRVGSHLYLTPANSQAVLPHYDNLNVIAIQLHGVKRWRIYAMDESLPTELQAAAIAPEALPTLDREVSMGPGQLLYLPPGQIHEACAEDALSIHVTLDIFTRSWADLIARMASQVPDLRHTLRAPTADGVAAAVRARLQSVGSAPPQRLLAQMSAEFITDLNPLPDDGFAQIDAAQSVHLGTKLRRRPGAFPCLVNCGDKIQFVFPGGGFAGPPESEEILRFLTAATSFPVARLPLLPDDAKLGLARDLITDGFLRIDDAPPPQGRGRPVFPRAGGDAAETGIEALLAPRDLDGFLACHWDQKPYCAQSKSRLERLIGLDDVDFLVASLTDPGDGIIIRPGEPVPRQLPPTIDLKAAYQAYAAGHSILLTRLERRWPPLSSLCRRVAEDFHRAGRPLGKHVGANAYLTPPQSQAFPPHFDNHHVFILQICGAKRWRVYGRTDAAPGTRQVERVQPSDLPPLVEELTLSPGEVLYIPQGMLHEAHTSGGSSLHITLSVFPGTVVDGSARSERQG